MVQGLGADKHGWDLQRVALVPHYRVIALDNRGAGRSDKPPGPYDLSEMAEDVMAQIAAELHERHDLCAIAITHRLGRVEVGEASVAIAVSAPHRHDALAACREAIDTLKETVPLWKKEVYEGGEEWIGRGS